jgi:hypothetical protein
MHLKVNLQWVYVGNVSVRDLVYAIEGKGGVICLQRFLVRSQENLQKMRL